MNSFFRNIIRKPTFVYVMTVLYFAYVFFLIVYKWFDPPPIGSSYKMILAMMGIFSVVPLVLFIIDRLLIIKINHIRLTVIEIIVFSVILTYYLLVVNPF